MRCIKERCNYYRNAWFDKKKFICELEYNESCFNKNDKDIYCPLSDEIKRLEELTEIYKQERKKIRG